jgi:hypothetical protein
MPDTTLPKRLVAGASISNSLADQGTLGLSVVDRFGNQYGLTCSHVVAPPALPNAMNEVIDSPAQPRGLAGSTPCGKVWTWSAFDLHEYNHADVALVALPLSTIFNNERLSLGPTPSPVNDVDRFLDSTPDPHIEIWTDTKPITGQIDRIYEEDDSKYFGFGGDRVNQFFFSRILGYRTEVQPGDSGAAVIHVQSRSVLGIHFASEPGMGYCIPFQSILDSFPDFHLTITA